MNVPRQVLPQVVIRAAWLYYAQGQRQEDIAKLLQVSRASIVNYLKQARDAGLVQIRIDTEYMRSDLLGIQLMEMFGLASVRIVHSDIMSGPISEAVAHVCAQQLIATLSDGDNLGVAWGRTVHAVGQALPVVRTTNVTVTQLCGNLGTPYGFVPEACTMEIAGRIGATCRNLYAPLVLSSPQLASELRAEPVVRRQLDAMKTCNRAIFSVGDCSPNSHVVTCGAMSRKELAQMAQRGAAAVIVGRLIDAKGRDMSNSKTDRLVSVSLDVLRAIQNRLMVVYGQEKAAATLAALKGGFATELVIDHDTAAKIVELAA